MASFSSAPAVASQLHGNAPAAEANVLRNGQGFGACFYVAMNRQHTSSLLFLWGSKGVHFHQSIDSGQQSSCRDLLSLSSKRVEESSKGRTYGQTSCLPAELGLLLGYKVG